MTLRLSWLTVVSVSGLLLMVIGHAGRPTWYWLLLPLASVVICLCADLHPKGVAADVA